MKLSEVFQKYELQDNQSSIIQHRAKIRKYINFVNDVNIDEERAFSKENLDSFIFNGDGHAKGKYDALQSFYSYVKITIEGMNKRSILFNISLEDVEQFDEENFDNNNSHIENTIYLPEDYNFDSLFDDLYYKHLCNEQVSKFLKAVLALGITAGYSTSEFFGKSENDIFKIEDIKVIDNDVMVKNFNKNSSNEWITITGKYTKHIIDYYNFRKTLTNIILTKKDIMFAMFWESRDIKHDSSISGSKPYRPQVLTLYILKYISNNSNNINGELKIKDLQCNMVLHSLYASKGTSLFQLIKTFGYPPFLKSAFEKYCQEKITNENDNILIDFFHSTPQDYIEESEASCGDDLKISTVLINKIKRDSKIVKELKEEYDNVCQICGKPIIKIKNLSYSEACHIHPRFQNGSDTKSNLLILCPNHHVLFDLGVITINPEDCKTLIHIEKDNELNGMELKVIKHSISSNYVRYHFENIYLPIAKALMGKD